MNTWHEFPDKIVRERDEIEQLRTENAALRECLRECADDLEAELDARYRPHDNIHPAMERRYDRDMEPVLRARALLGEL